MAKKENKAKKQENNKIKISFFKDFKAELKKVVWPTPKQLVNNTVAVITIVLITALIVFVLDLAFETMNSKGIDKIRDVISTENEAVENNTTSSEENTTEDANTVSEDNNTITTDEANTTNEVENNVTE